MDAIVLRHGTNTAGSTFVVSTFSGVGVCRQVRKRKAAAKSDIVYQKGSCTYAIQRSLKGAQIIVVVVLHCKESFHSGFFYVLDLSLTAMRSHSVGVDCYELLPLWVAPHQDGYRQAESHPLRVGGSSPTCAVPRIPFPCRTPDRSR